MLHIACVKYCCAASHLHRYSQLATTTTQDEQPGGDDASGSEADAEALDAMEPAPPPPPNQVPGNAMDSRSLV